MISGVRVSRAHTATYRLSQKLFVYIVYRYRDNSKLFVQCHLYLPLLLGAKYKRGNLQSSLTPWNQCASTIMRRCLRDNVFNRFDGTSTCDTPFTRYNLLSYRLNNRLNNRLHRVNGVWQTDKRTDGWTRSHSIFCASIASCDKHVSKTIPVNY